MLRAFAAVLVLALGSASVSFAQSDFYEGKTIELVVGFSPGGGTDTFARFIAGELGTYIPGSPSVVVRNMPGAGSVVASNWYVDTAEPNGETLLVGTGQLMLRILLGLRGSEASLADLDAILAQPTGRIGYLDPALGASEPEDYDQISETLILGVPDHISTIESILALEVLGADFRVIPGYEGKSEVRLAFERGEVNVDAQTTPVYRSSVEPLIEQGSAVTFFSQGLINGAGDLVRDPAAPEIPTVAEVYEAVNGMPPSGNAWEAYRAAVVAIGNAGKILMIHQNAPAEAKEALEVAAQRMSESDDFRAAAEEFFEGYEMNHGDDLAGAVRAVQQLDPAVLTWLEEYLSSNFNVSFE